MSLHAPAVESENDLSEKPVFADERRGRSWRL